MRRPWHLREARTRGSASAAPLLSCVDVPLNGHGSRHPPRIRLRRLVLNVFHRSVQIRNLDPLRERRTSPDPMELSVEQARSRSSRSSFREPRQSALCGPSVDATRRSAERRARLFTITPAVRALRRRRLVVMGTAARDVAVRRDTTGPSAKVSATRRIIGGGLNPVGSDGRTDVFPMRAHNAAKR